MALFHIPLAPLPLSFFMVVFSLILFLCVGVVFRGFFSPQTVVCFVFFFNLLSGRSGMWRCLSGRKVLLYQPLL